MITELQLSQLQSTLISRQPITGLPTARPITEHLNFAITGYGEWSAEILLIFDENVTLPTTQRRRLRNVQRQQSWFSAKSLPTNRPFSPPVLDPTICTLELNKQYTK